MENFNKKYFLAANSAEGFVSNFGSSYNAELGWHSIIIKGGPGTGKSSFMKYISAAADKKGLEVVLCPCSSDPDSLDAVIFPQIKTVIMDGTSPHTVEPLYPGVCEEIINLGEFWQTEKLLPFSKEIIKLTNENKSLHKLASRYIKTAGAFMRENYETAYKNTDFEKIDNFTQKLLKHIPKKNGKGYEWIRYFGGVTPKGVVSFANTVFKECNNITIIKDKFGSISSYVFENLRKHALSSGYEIITVKNPLLPSLMTDGIIIPELSTAFIREYNFSTLKSDNRRINAERFIRKDFFVKKKERLKLNDKISKEMLLSAISVLKNAKEVHDKLESYYISAMDFDTLSKFAINHADTILKNLP